MGCNRRENLRCLSRKALTNFCKGVTIPTLARHLSVRLVSSSNIDSNDLTLRLITRGIFNFVFVCFYLSSCSREKHKHIIPS